MAGVVIPITSSTDIEDNFNTLLEFYYRLIDREVVGLQRQLQRDIYIAFGRKLTPVQIDKLKNEFIKKRMIAGTSLESELNKMLNEYLTTVPKGLNPAIKNSVLFALTNQQLGDLATDLFNLENTALKYINDIARNERLTDFKFLVRELSHDMNLTDIKKTLESFVNVVKPDYEQRLMSQLEKHLFQDGDLLYFNLGGKKYRAETYLDSRSKWFTQDLINKGFQSQVLQDNFDVCRFVRTQSVKEPRPHSEHENRLFSLSGLSGSFNGEEVRPVSVIDDYTPFDPPYGCKHTLIGVGKKVSDKPVTKEPIGDEPKKKKTPIEDQPTEKIKQKLDPTLAETVLDEIFTPATTIEEAKQFLKDQAIAKTVVDVGGLDLDTFNAVNKQLLYLKQKYGLRPLNFNSQKYLKKKKRTSKTIWASANYDDLNLSVDAFFNKKKLKTAFEDFTGETYKKNYKKYVNDYEVYLKEAREKLDEAKEAVKKLEDKIKKETDNIVISNLKHELYYLKNNVSQLRSNINTNQKNLDGMIDVLKYDAKNFLVKDLEIESVITHEIGHTISDLYYAMINEYNIYKNKDSVFIFPIERRKAFVKEWREVVVKLYKEEYQYKISKYATTDADEMFAECFTAYELKKDLIPDYVVEFFDDMVKEIQEFNKILEGGE